MKFIYLTDIHIRGNNPINRKDNYPLAIINKLKELNKIIEISNIDAILCGGDLFDVPAISNKILCQIAEVLLSYKIPIYITPGNHDIVGQSLETLEHTSIGILASTGVIHLLDKTPTILTKGNDKVAITGHAFTPELDSPETKDTDYMIQRIDNAYNILISHSMVVEKPFVGNYTIIDELQTNADMVLTGHYHPERFDRRLNNDYSTMLLKPRAVSRKENTVQSKTYLPEFLLLEILGHKLNKYQFRVFNSASLDVFKDKVVKEVDIQEFSNKIDELDRDKWKSLNVQEMIKEIAREMNLEKPIISLALGQITTAQLNDQENNPLKDFIPINEKIYIKEIDIKNFQSHSSTKIELDKGMNALVGQSHCGKTAIIRAINWCLYNEPRGVEYIKEGTSRTQVKITLSNGDYIARIRSNETGENCYIINGKKYTGFGTNLPIEVINTSQMPKVKIGKNLSSINYASQLESPFLLSITTGDRANSIGSITNTEIIDNAVSNISKEISSKQRELTSLVANTNSLQNQVDSYLPLHLYKQEINKLESLLFEISDLTTKIKEIQDIEKRYKELKTSLNKAKQEKNRYIHNIDLNELIDINNKYVLAYSYRILNIDLDKENRVPIPPTIEDLEPLLEHYNYFKRLNENYQQYTIDLNKIPRYNKIEINTNELEELLSKFNYINNLKERYNQLKNKNTENIYLDISTIDIKEMESIEEQYKGVIAMKKSIEDLNKNLQLEEEEVIILDQKKAELLLQYEKILKECKICPVCGQSIPDDIKIQE